MTGHTGFKGSWLSLWLHRLGAEVHGYALGEVGEPSHFAAAGVRDVLAGHVEADIRDVASLERALEESAPDVVFHLAAQSLVRPSYEEPAETFDVNVMGTVQLLEALRRRGKACSVVVVTSDKCYANQEHVWGYRECDAMGGADPYSASKGAAELVVDSYRRSFFPPGSHVKVASARAGNVIGGGDWAAYRLVPDIVRALSEGEPIKVRNPGALRPWQHVLEPLGGYLLLASRLLSTEEARWCTGWNFGPGAEDKLTVRQLVEVSCEVWGEGRWEQEQEANAPHEAYLLQLSIDKATWELGWKPVWSSQQAIEATIRWYRTFYDAPEAAMQEVSMGEIAAYEAAWSAAQTVDRRGS